MPRESSKCRIWEKERRERLNEAFDELAKRLPCYDPSIAISKIDILRKAALNIQELQEKVNNLISSNPEKKSTTEDVIIKKLQDRVKKLLVRNEQLSNLLRDAGITVPSACGTIKKFKGLPWSKKISAEQAKVLQKKEMDKENMSSKVAQGKKKKAKTVSTPIKHRTVIVNGVEHKAVTPNKRKNKKKSPLNNYFIVLSQLPAVRRDIRQQFYLIPSQTSALKNPIKSGVVSKPTIVAAKPKPVKKFVQVNPAITNPPLGPGTLILADGTIMPVIPQIQTPAPINSKLLVNPNLKAIPKTIKTQDNETERKISGKVINKLPFIRAKYCLTKTTQVNKVPIPALTSRYANNQILLIDTKKEEKVKDIAKKSREPLRTDKKKGDKRKCSVEDESKSKKVKSECREPSAASLIIIDKSGNLISPLEADAPSKCNDAASPDISVKKPDAVKNEKEQAEDTEKDSAVPNSGVATIPFFEKLHSTETATNENVSTPNVSTAPVTVMTTTNDDMKHLEMNLPPSELSNDIFASLQVPSGCQNPESTSPTAAFLLAFPLVSSGAKVTEVIEEENSESQRGTPNLLQMATMESTKPTLSHADAATSNFLNLDNFSFFSSKDVCGSFYNAEAKPRTITTTSVSSTSSTNTATASVFVNSFVPAMPPNQSKERPRNINSCMESTGGQQRPDDNTFALHNPASFKGNSNCDTSKCNPPQSGTNEVKPPQYYPPTTYSQASTYTYKNDSAKTCATCSYAHINRNYADPLYTNCKNYSYNCHRDTAFNQNYYKNVPRNDATKPPYHLTYNNYTEAALPTRYYEGPTYVKDKRSSNNAAKMKTSQNKPINWMTTPDNRLQTSECLLNSFSKGDFSQTYPTFNSYVTSASAYFTTSTVDTGNGTCAVEAKNHPQQRPEAEERQFPWSPTKLPHFLDTPHNYVTPTLPTLVGDLALGNPVPPFEQKTHIKDIRRTKVNSYENQSTFLSVSQLVDHTKLESVPAKTSTTRRNSGNRSKSTAQPSKKRPPKQDMLATCVANAKGQPANNYNSDIFPEHKNRNAHKNVSSSYSAEALIGHQVPDDTRPKRYPPSAAKPNFLAENIISYFPTVDIPQDNNYVAQNQNYQANFTHNLATTLQNNTYSTNSFMYTAPAIAPSYLGTNAFEAAPHDYLQDTLNLIPSTAAKDGKHKQFTNRQPGKEEGNNCVVNNSKRHRRKADSNVVPANFDFPFLSKPGSNNSPILPDDFHPHTTFLTPATPFSCKNSVYPKQTNDMGTAGSILPLPPVGRCNIQRPENSPSMNTAGTSLTNFNLSTIFPEINKGQMTEMYPAAVIKNPCHSKTYTAAAPPQVPFNSEPKFNFSM